MFCCFRSRLSWAARCGMICRRASGMAVCLSVCWLVHNISPVCYINNSWMGCHELLYSLDWFWDDESYWLRRSPDISSIDTIGLIFMILSEIFSTIIGQIAITYNHSLTLVRIREAQYWIFANILCCPSFFWLIPDTDICTHCFFHLIAKNIKSPVLKWTYNYAYSYCNVSLIDAHI